MHFFDSLAKTFFPLFLLHFCVKISALPFSFSPNPNVKISWGLTNEETRILIQMEVQAKSWLGIGWHCQGCSETLMTKADFAIGTFAEDGTLVVKDYFANSANDGFTKPSLDENLGGYQNIIAFQGIQADSYTSMTFERDLVTNDTTADHPFKKGKMRVIWAHGKDNEFKQHGGSSSDRGEALIDFFTGSAEVVNTEQLKYWHGSLMTFAFGVCMTFGIFIARYLKEYYWWFPLHIIVQVTGVLVAISAFIIALVMSKDGHFKNLHSWFGLVTLYLAIIVPALGWAADLTFDPNRVSVPIWPDLIHRWGGRITVLLAYVTIILGMRQLGVEKLFEIIFGVCVGYFLVLYGYLEFYRRTNAKVVVDH